MGHTLIPRKLHIVWVGDEAKRPDNCIDSWRHKNPGFDIKVWGNDDLANTAWRNAHHMQEFIRRDELCGVADCMRWEILYEHGGIALDADTFCLKSLPDWLLRASEFCCWENEIDRPGLLANCFVGAQAGSAFVGQIIEDIHASKLTDDLLAWQFSGPQRLTDVWRNFQYNNLTIYPSHYFIPEHFAGQRYTGDGHVFARQFWGSTRKIYDSLYMAECLDERE